MFYLPFPGELQHVARIIESIQYVPRIEFFEIRFPRVSPGQVKESFDRGEITVGHRQIVDIQIVSLGFRD
jgi:hypothetical protein